jgi:head-tail adaptor
MHIGRLDRQIKIDSPTVQESEDYGAGGGSAPVWSEFLTCFANVKDILAGSKEATNQEIRLTKRPVRVQMRYVDGITTGMRVTMLDRGRVLQIVTPPAEIGRKEGIEFMCEEFSS